MKYRPTMDFSARFMCLVVLASFLVLYYGHIFSWRSPSSSKISFSKRGSNLPETDVRKGGGNVAELQDLDYREELEDIDVLDIREEPVTNATGGVSDATKGSEKVGTTGSNQNGSKKVEATDHLSSDLVLSTADLKPEVQFGIEPPKLEEKTVNTEVGISDGSHKNFPIGKVEMTEELFEDDIIDVGPSDEIKLEAEGIHGTGRSEIGIVDDKSAKIEFSEVNPEANYAGTGSIISNENIANFIGSGKSVEINADQIPIRQSNETPKLKPIGIPELKPIGIPELEPIGTPELKPQSENPEINYSPLIAETALHDDQRVRDNIFSSQTEFQKNLFRERVNHLLPASKTAPLFRPSSSRHTADFEQRLEYVPSSMNHILHSVQGRVRPMAPSNPLLTNRNTFDSPNSQFRNEDINFEEEINNRLQNKAVLKSMYKNEPDKISLWNYSAKDEQVNPDGGFGATMHNKTSSILFSMDARSNRTPDFVRQIDSKLQSSDYIKDMIGNRLRTTGGSFSNERGLNVMRTMTPRRKFGDNGQSSLYKSDSRNIEDGLKGLGKSQLQNLISSLHDLYVKTGGKPESELPSSNIIDRYRAFSDGKNRDNQLESKRTRISKPLLSVDDFGLGIGPLGTRKIGNDWTNTYNNMGKIVPDRENDGSVEDEIGNDRITNMEIGKHQQIGKDWAVNEEIGKQLKEVRNDQVGSDIGKQRANLRKDGIGDESNKTVISVPSLNHIPYVIESGLNPDTVKQIRINGSRPSNGIKHKLLTLLNQTHAIQSDSSQNNNGLISNKMSAVNNKDAADGSLIGNGFNNSIRKFLPRVIEEMPQDRKSVFQSRTLY